MLPGAYYHDLPEQGLRESVLEPRAGYLDR